MNTRPRVKSVECIGNFRVRVTFTDDFVGNLDLEPVLRGFYFEPLRQPERFREVSVSHGTLVWPNEADLCPDVLRYWCELGRVCTQQELDAHFGPKDSALVLHDKPKP